jgi:glutamate-1-semialdehyde 2,1-aminomutase
MHDEEGSMDKGAVYRQWMGKLVKRYQERTPKSAKLHGKAQQYLPGGDTRTATFFDPYPVFMARGKGCRFTDVDGNVYIDFLNNYTSLIHGHAHPAIVRAVIEQVPRGASYAAPVESQTLLAEMICDRVKSVEQIRFCNSGTEATMNAIRAARILTGKSKIVKMEGGYHGTHDLGEVSFSPRLDQAGPVEKPRSVPQSKGTPKSICDEVIVVPFNNKGVTEKIIRENQHEIAGVIVEPMLGAAGCIVQEEGYLEFLRKLTRTLNLVLIFDEVVTFRFGPGGAQEIYHVDPDITAFGKIIGGGFPVGAFGGSREIMKIYSPREKGFVSQSGTFNGNPITVEAGIACLKALTPKVYERINSLGDVLRKGLGRTFGKNGLKGSATGMCSLAWPHFNSQKVSDYRSASKGNFEAMALVHMALLQKGINVARRGGECSISTPMTEKEVRIFVADFEESLSEVRPFIEQTTPDLIT